jgi:hypothetical protein
VIDPVKQGDGVGVRHNRSLHRMQSITKRCAFIVLSSNYPAPLPPSIFSFTAPSAPATDPAHIPLDYLDCYLQIPILRDLQAYVSYKVVSTTKLPQYKARSNEVIRRFRDFSWLSRRLRSENRGVIVPALPERSVVEKYKMTAEFIEQRRAALTVFINRVVGF